MSLISNNPCIAHISDLCLKRTHSLQVGVRKETLYSTGGDKLKLDTDDDSETLVDPGIETQQGHLAHKETTLLL